MKADALVLGWDYVQGPDPAVSFNIYKWTAPDAICAGTRLQYAGVPIDARTWADTVQTPGQRYCYAITAVDAAQGESTPSNVVSFQVPNPPPVPAAPMNLRIQ